MSEPSGARHVFDGIEEHDNHLPNWWLGILWGTLVFAAGYWLYFHTFGLGPKQLEEYQAELAAAARPSAPSTAVAGGAAGPGGAVGGEGGQPGAPPPDEQKLLALATDEPTQKRGREEFARTCASCHGPEGAGLIGPNLTDAFFIHGAGPAKVRAVIARGATEKGMPAWEPTLGAERVTALTAYVLTLKGKNLPGRPPQGEPE